MPRVLWMSALVGFTAGAILALVGANHADLDMVSAQRSYEPNADKGRGFLCLALLAWALGCGFFGCLVGLGVGSFFYAPPGAILGAVILCLPFACLLSLSYAQMPVGHPSRGEEHWYIGVMIFAIPASCGAGLGAITTLWREGKK
jgi:hypothetical protein